MGRITALACGFLALGSVGCSHMSNTARGAFGGAGLGAGAGALVGAATGGDAGKGALIGAGIGGLTGTLVGNDIDQQERRDLENRVIAAEARESAVTASPVSVDQVVSMSQSGVPEDVIVNQIRTTGATFHLTANDLSWLKSNAVSDRVIIEMQNTRHAPVPVRRTGPVVIEHEQPVIIHRHRPVRVIEVGPHRHRPPGFHFGVGFHDHHCW